MHQLKHSNSIFLRSISSTYLLFLLYLFIIPLSISFHFIWPMMLTIPPSTSTCFLMLAPLLLLCLWKLINWVWLRPKRLERALREQGLQGNPYKFLVGDTREMISVLMQAAKSQQSKSSLSDDKDVAPHITTFNHHIVHKFGTLF